MRIAVPIVIVTSTCVVFEIWQDLLERLIVYENVKKWMLRI